MAEAVAQLRKALAALADQPDEPWRREKELDLQLALRSALTATKGAAATEVGETLTRARALAEELDRPEYLVPLLYGQRAFHSVRAEHRLALSLADQLEEIGKARNDVAVELLGRRAKGLTRFFLGDFAAARALLEQCHDLVNPAYRAVGPMSDDLYVGMLAFLATTLTYLGCVDQARSRLNEALSEARRLKHAFTLALVLWFANWMGWITRSPDLQRYAEEFLTLSTEHEFSLFLGWATVFRGRSLTALGRAQEGLAVLSQGLAAVRATGAVARTPQALMMLADAFVVLGELAEGLNCLTKAEEIVESTDERVDEAELRRLRGDFLIATGDSAKAETTYHQAIEVAQRQSAKLVELRASTSLARLWRDQGKRIEARDLLAPIYGWFSEGFDTPDLKKATALLEELR
jgi:tetratricopeptide (TPR) repeat protein